MIFSVWNPDGGYDYFESKQRHGIGDDLPDISMPAPSGGLGVPAQDVGRRVPMGAKRVGRGSIPKGVIAPMDRSQVRGLSGTALAGFGGDSVFSLFIAGALVWVGYELGKRA